MYHCLYHRWLDDRWFNMMNNIVLILHDNVNWEFVIVGDFRL